MGDFFLDYFLFDCTLSGYQETLVSFCYVIHYLVYILEKRFDPFSIALLRWGQDRWSICLEFG